MSQTKAQLIDAVDGSIVTADLADDAVNADKLASNSVVSASIVDGSIVNADINASAAIAASKIADFVSNNTNNRVLTATGTANSLNGESTLTYDGAGNLTVINASGAAGVFVETPSNTDGGIYFRDSSNTGAVTYQHSDDSMRFRVNSTEKLRIASDGKVGLGTTSPDQTLHVHKGSAGSISSTANSVLTLENSNDSILQFLSPNSNVNQLRFGDPQDNGAGYIDYNHGNNALTFGTNGPEKMRLDSSGQLGIGTTSPSNILHIEDGNPYLEIEGTANSGDAGIFFNAKANHWNLRADNSGSQNSFGLKSGTPASSTHTISIVGQAIDFFQNRNIYQRVTSGTMAIADGANKAFTITGLGYGWAKLQLAFYGEGQFCNVEVTVGGLMASGSQYYSATIIANGSSGSCDVNFGANQTSYVVTISNNVGNGGSMHGTALFTGSGGSAHPNIAVS